MGSGVIIDDGGSTRIKWMGLDEKQDVTGRLEHLLNVSEVETGGRSTHEIASDTYERMLIVWQDQNGFPHNRDIDSFLPGEKIRITSHLKQHLEVENTGTGLRISLHGEVIEPVVEARQHDLKRRYIVTNSGQIMKVTKVDLKGNETPVYDIENPKLAPSQPVIYTSVVLK